MHRARVCELIPFAAVRRALVRAGASAPREAPSVANDSLDLSICDWHGGSIEDVRVSIDSASRAQLRFFNMLAEQLEYHNANPAQRPRQLRGVGQDSAYGGAGAWWTTGRKQLVAYSRQRACCAYAWSSPGSTTPVAVRSRPRWRGSRSGVWAERRRDPQRDLELEAGVGVLQALAEQVAQAAEAVADGLGMHVQGAGHLLGAPTVAQPGRERLGEPGARTLALLGERREGTLGQVDGEAPVGAEQQREAVLVGTQ